MIGEIDTEVAATVFAEAINLNTEYGKYILKKNFKTMELINLKSQQYVRLNDNKALQQQMAVKVFVAPPLTLQSGNKRLIPQHTEEANKKRNPNERQFEPLNTSLYQIYIENKDFGIFRTLRPIKVPLKK